MTYRTFLCSVFAGVALAWIGVYYLARHAPLPEVVVPQAEAAVPPPPVEPERPAIAAMQVTLPADVWVGPFATTVTPAAPAAPKHKHKRKVMPVAVRLESQSHLPVPQPAPTPKVKPEPPHPLQLIGEFWVAWFRLVTWPITVLAG